MKDKVFEDAKLYQTMNDWRDDPNSLYKIAKEKRWIKECCKHMPPAEWQVYPERYTD